MNDAPQLHELISAAKGAQDCLHDIDKAIKNLIKQRYNIGRQIDRLQSAIDLRREEIDERE